jgi:MinD-like ATPase involved in chromosome partitioning or flagellar assembly
MKHAILNFSGSVGKTVVATHLLKPRMNGAIIFAIESTNQSAADLGVADVEQLAGKQYGDLLQKLILEDDAIIDIGASNIESFFEAASRYAGAIDEFDTFIIPVTPEQKSWQESLKTVEALSALGVPAEKIRLLPNRIAKDPVDEIPSVFNYVKKSKKAWISADAFIFESEIYGYLAHKKMSFDALVNDEQDYKQLARAAEDPETRNAYASMYRWKQMAIPVRNNLNDCFNTLTGQ